MLTKDARKFELDNAARLNFSTVRHNFAAILSRVEAGEIIIVTKHGKDAAALVPLSFLPGKKH